MFGRSHNDPFEKVRDTYAGLEVVLSSMNKAAKRGDTEKLFELHKSLLNTIVIINMFMESRQLNYELECDYESNSSELDFLLEKATKLITEYMKAA